MSLRVKRYTLKYGGKLYGAGAVIDMPDADTRRFAQSNPAAFEFIKPAAVSAARKTTKAAAPTKAAAEGLPAADLSKAVKGK